MRDFFCSIQTETFGSASYFRGHLTVLITTREGSALPKTYLTLNKPLLSSCEPLDIAVYFRGHLTVHTLNKKRVRECGTLF